MWDHLMITILVLVMLFFNSVSEAAAGEKVTYCWEADATGAGLITADGALSGTP